MIGTDVVTSPKVIRQKRREARTDIAQAFSILFIPICKGLLCRNFHNPAIGLSSCKYIKAYLHQEIT